MCAILKSPVSDISEWVLAWCFYKFSLGLPWWHWAPQTIKYRWLLVSIQAKKRKQVCDRNCIRGRISGGQVSQFGFKGGVIIARASNPSPWKYQMYPLLRPSSRLDSRLDVRRNQVANLVNVSLDEGITNFKYTICFSLFGYIEQWKKFPKDPHLIDIT